ncbi:MAG: RidA family protein [Rhodospirillales bacterium]|nr:RidA family protein [Rhodospirillales bacterium]
MVKFFNPDGVAAPGASYSHAALVPGGMELLFISGQLGTKPDGSIGDTIEDQAAQAFRNIETILASEGLTPADLVKVQMFLTDRAYRAPAGEARQKVFGDAKPVSTLLIVAGLAAPEFMIEVEAIAARSA